jgi:hypothetical protein
VAVFSGREALEALPCEGKNSTIDQKFRLNVSYMLPKPEDESSKDKGMVEIGAGAPIVVGVPA